MSLKLTYRKARSKRKKVGTYYIEGTYRGHRVHESLHTSDRDIANERYTKKVAELDAEETHGVKAVANFAAAVVAYGEKLKKMKGIETNSNEPYLREMVPLIGETKLRELTQSDLDELAKRMRPGASLETLKRHVYTPFMAAYNAAVQRDPPLADPKHWAAPKGKKRKGNCPDDAYISKLVDAADIHERKGKHNNVVTGSRKPERDKAVVLFLTFTGARSGEAQRLSLRDVFLERGYAMLRRTSATRPDHLALCARPRVP
jgi:integrase